MSFSLSSWFDARFFKTGNNAPLVGGKIYTYLAGTTTQAATYSDTSGTPNTNPIILDADGKASIFLDDTVSYRLILKDANDVTLSDFDNIVSTAKASIDATIPYVDEAEAFASEAEAARDAAFTNANVYASTAAGLAATTNGQQFTVVSGYDLIRYRNDSGSATEVARTPTSSYVKDVENSETLIEEQPNLFTRELLSFETLPTILLGTQALDVYDTVKTLKVNTETTGGTSRIYWRFPASDFASNFISAQITVMSSDVGTGGTISIIQRDSGLSSIQVDNLVTGVASAISTKTTYKVNSISKNGLCAWVDLDIQFSKTTGDKARSTRVRGMMVANGKDSFFKFPPPVIPVVPVFDYFPNPSLNSNGATLFGGSTVIEDGESTLQMSGSSLVQSYYDVAAIGVFSEGSNITFSADVYCDYAASTATSTTAADIAIIMLDSALSTISTNYIAVQAADAYVNLSKSVVVPSGAAFVRFRFVKRATTATFAKFRRPTVISDSEQTEKIALNDINKSPMGALGRAYVSTSGNDGTGDGTSGNPVATINKALQLLGGSGTVVLTDAEYTQTQRITASLVKGHVLVTGTFASGAYTIVRMNDALTSITKTSGRTKIYQANVSGITTTPNWIYEDGIPDATTTITNRMPHHKGREYRLPCAKIPKTIATVLADALTEIDASSTPLCFYNSGVMYFSISGGGDATSSQIYFDNSQGIITQVASFSSSSITFQDLDIRYGHIDSRAFRRTHLSNVSVFGARSNCWDYRGCASFENLETSCAGSFTTDGTGDGVNGHGSGNLVGVSLYSHDNMDDGESSHEWCSVRMSESYFEYNGGTAVAPALGCDAVYSNCVSYRNQQISGRKAAAFLAVGSPIDDGEDTLVYFIGCRSIDDDVSFGDSGGDVVAVCENCESIDAVTTAYNVTKIKNCRFSGSATQKAGRTVVENTTLVV
jgi:hypothetical protein